MHKDNLNGPMTNLATDGYALLFKQTQHRIIR